VLDDRSTNVKYAAASLLARIPDSALSKRMLMRADALLSFEKKMLKKSKLHVAPVPGDPKELDEQWKRDGLNPAVVKNAKIFQQELGRIISFVPLSHWTERFESTPEDLLSTLRDLSEKDALLSGWSQALFLHNDKEWIGPLLDRQWQAWDTETLKRLIKLLPQQMMEQKIALLTLENDDQAMLLNALPRPWSTEFGEICLQKLRGYIESHKKQKNSYYYYQTALIDSIAVALPPACFEQAFQLEDLREEDSKDWAINRLNERLSNFIETLKIRKRILEEIH
jgi:hypothetical protein